MKIRLAILERDSNYLNRIEAAFSAKYPDKFEIYTFTDSEVALSTLASSRIDVLIASDVFDIDTKKIPVRCGFAYFVDSLGIDTVKNEKAICKFQKADLIYKQILGIYSETADSITGYKIDEENCKLIVFASPSGGVGSSTMAAACALHLAAAGKRALYLNLEKYGSSDVFFSAEGQFDISDIIFALKSKKANLPLKLESCVKQDKRGVYFYSQTKVALDMVEIKTEEILLLISELKLTGSYDYIVLDMDFGIEKKYLDIYKQAASIMVVGDGSEISNMKICRAYEALLVLEQNFDFHLSDRLMLLYNKFNNSTGIAIEDIGINNIGGMPKYPNTNTEQLLSQLSGMGVFDKIM